MILDKKALKVASMASLGGALEMYDFLAYMFFAPLISRAFFPEHDETARLLATFGIFAVGYLFRPVGGIIFSHFGDLIGRKTPFSLTIILMALATFAIGFLPGYATLGIWAPIILVILRCLQGISVGGELPGALIYTAESTAVERRGFSCSIVFFGVNLGLLLATAISALLYLLLDQQTLQQYGWRAAFILGGMLGYLGYHIRRNLQESPVFQAMLAIESKESAPLLTVFRQHKKPTIMGMLLIGQAAAIISIVFLYMPTYLPHELGYAKGLASYWQTAATLLFSLAILVAGYFSDKFGRLTLIRLGCVLFIVLSLPAYYLLTHTSVLNLAISYLLLATIASISTTMACAVLETFPTEVRYTGLAISYNLAYAFIGGLSPLVVTYMIEVLGYQLAPAIFLVAVSVIALLASYFVLDRTGKQL